MDRIFFRRAWRKTLFSIVSLVTLLSGVLMPFLALAQEDTLSAQTEINNDINKYKKKLEAATKKKAELEQNLNQVNVSLGVAVSAIRKTQAAILDTTDSITRASLEIELSNQQIALKRAVLADLLREAYLGGSSSSADIILGDRTVSDIFDVSTQFAMIGSRIGGILNDMEQLKSGREVEKATLETMRKETEAALAKKNAEKAMLAANQAAIAQDVAEQQATIAELQQKLSKLQGELSSLLGESVSTDDIKKAAGIASDATGVRKSFILAELTQESGLGTYTGGCTYKNTRVKSADAAAFKGIMKELGYDVNSKKISCASKSGGYGGAMGIAQFMPTTWLGYKSYISGATGHTPPDPWSVVDGVMGMAKKLANAGATNKKGEYNASMIYYCGTSKPTNTYPGRVAACNRYAANVQRLTNGYEKD